MSYVPVATQTSEPLESRTVESAALEFRTLKNFILGLEAQLDALEAAIASLGGSGGLPGMVYIQRESGTGTQTEYTLIAVPAALNKVDVYVQGIYQQHNTFTVSGSVLTFSEAPLAGVDNIEIQISVMEMLTPVPEGDFLTFTGVETATNKTFINPTITNYTETVSAPAAGSNFTVSLALGTVHKFTTNANTSITLPASVAGKNYTVVVAYGGVHTLIWSGGTNLKWHGGAAPTPTSVNGKFDIFVFTCDGINTYGRSGGSNY